MVDRAENWVTSYMSFRKYVAWHEFIIDLSARFRDETGNNVVEQFKRLEQKGSLEAYIYDFEDLRSVLSQNNHYLPDSFVLDSFIGRLKPSVKLFVKAFKPSTIAQSTEYARLKEESLEVEGSRFSKFSHSYNNKPSGENSKVFTNNSSKPALLPTPQIKPASFPKYVPSTHSGPNKNFKYIPADVRAEKIAKGLCYYCDQPFHKGHKCSFKEQQLFTVEILLRELIIVNRRSA
ncbi:unnamed protein product [Cuscuta campestris]|uniref:Ty3 transposon capsid-like protein domain-containing protein n=1 Tax=Cuscuta campestris TaxID=132261 RepID=A0A484L2V0_9ASTE|nr:unnamed protein product [Cuscuta campestris]